MQHKSELNTNKQIIVTTVALTIIAGCISIISTNQAIASKSPYRSGYDHGCDDADISDPDDRYINQPERGPSFHTEEFMSGYYDGFNACSVGGGGGSNGEDSRSPYRSGYEHGASDARDDCSDGCDWYILEPGKGFGFHTEEFNQGYIDGFCDNSSPGRGSDADEATFSCP